VLRIIPSIDVARIIPKPKARSEKGAEDSDFKTGYFVSLIGCKLDRLRLTARGLGAGCAVGLVPGVAVILGVDASKMPGRGSAASSTPLGQGVPRLCLA